jgi:hypothetical protein
VTTVRHCSRLVSRRGSTLKFGAKAARASARRARSDSRSGVAALSAFCGQLGDHRIGLRPVHQEARQIERRLPAKPGDGLGTGLGCAAQQHRAGVESHAELELVPATASGP